jgi:hypothetical protein
MAQATHGGANLLLHLCEPRRKEKLREEKLREEKTRAARARFVAAPAFLNHLALLKPRAPGTLETVPRATLTGPRATLTARVGG